MSVWGYVRRGPQLAAGEELYAEQVQQVLSLMNARFAGGTMLVDQHDWQSVIERADILVTPSLAHIAPRGGSGAQLADSLHDLLNEDVMIILTDPDMEMIIGERTEPRRLIECILFAGSVLEQERTFARTADSEADDGDRGRPRKMTPARISEAEAMIRAGSTLSEVADHLHVGVSTLRRYVRVSAVRDSAPDGPSSAQL